jgi:alkanesulfonate monooxygenase SsuD/methylene tetrahydromethanopterin reductase-like flavin-dependent oxidoreductase (luciferase family)
MTAMCGEIADGIILTRSTLKTAAEIRKNLTVGTTIANREPTAVAITSLLPTAVAETRAEAMDMMRPGLALYIGFFPRYNKLIASHGFEQEAADIATAFKKGDMEAANRGVTDAIVDATGVAGTPSQCRERIEAYRDSGIDLPIISPFARGPGAQKVFMDAIKACVED